jgi:hypothetical protein
MGCLTGSLASFEQIYMGVSNTIVSNHVEPLDFVGGFSCHSLLSVAICQKDKHVLRSSSSGVI